MTEYLPDSFFKNLDVAETLEYQQWARENYNKGDEINPCWHYVVREECERINSEE